MSIRIRSFITVLAVAIVLFAAVSTHALSVSVRASDASVSHPPPKPKAKAGGAGAGAPAKWQKAKPAGKTKMTAEQKKKFAQTGVAPRSKKLTKAEQSVMGRSKNNEAKHALSAKELNAASAATNRASRFYHGAKAHSAAGKAQKTFGKEKNSRAAREDTANWNRQVAAADLQRKAGAVHMKQALNPFAGKSKKEGAYKPDLVKNMHKNPEAVATHEWINNKQTVTSKAAAPKHLKKNARSENPMGQHRIRKPQSKEEEASQEASAAL